MPTVTVLIPFYNRVQWVVEAVQSVLDQTYTDFEIILVDDGSTEDLTPLQQLADERIRYVRQANKGVSAARNLGLDLARGRYIAFLDSDDLFMPDKLEKQVTCMEQRPDVVISHTSYQLMSREGEYIKDMPSGKLFSGKVYPLIYVKPNIAPSTVMIRRDALDDTVRFREQIHLGEDLLFFVHFVKKSELIGIEEPLTKFRVHGQNAGMDPNKLAEAMINSAHYGLSKDKDLPFTLRRKLLSTRYPALGNLYLGAIYGQNAGMDPNKLAEGIINIAHYRLLKDKALSFTMRRKFLSTLYLALANIYLAKWEKANLLYWALRALGAWPLNYRVHEFLALRTRDYIIGNLRRVRKKLTRS